MKYFRHEVKGSRIDLYPLVCWHLGAKQCAHKFIDRVIAEIAENPHARWLYMGDGGECVTRTSKGNIYEQLMSPGAQLRTVADLLAPIKHKALGGIRGNHGNRVDKDSGLGWDETLCSRIGIPYLGVSCFGDIILKKHDKGCQTTFSLFAHHGSASAITDGGKVNAGFKPAQFIDADVVLTAHTHACGKLFPRHRAVTNGAMRRIDWRVQNFYVCGSAYDSRSGYAEEKMYSPILPEHIVISAEAKRPWSDGKRIMEVQYTHRHIHGFARDSANREDLLKWGDAA